MMTNNISMPNHSEDDDNPIHGQSTATPSLHHSHSCCSHHEPGHIHGHDHLSSSSVHHPHNKEMEELLQLISSLKDSSISQPSNFHSSTTASATAALLKQTDGLLPLEHKFWRTQPVPQQDLDLVSNEPIEQNKIKEQIRQEPYPLPAPYIWSDLDLLKSDHLIELYNLLSNNYVEDDDAMFRFDYPIPFLQWALLSPGWRREWHVGVRVTGSNKLVAFISAIPIIGTIRGKEKELVQVNFLCIHKKLRMKRLSPVLIKEITRRVNLLGGIFQAVYTAGIFLPQPISTCQYFHRPLNFKRLYDCGFSSIPPNSTLPKMIKAFDLKVVGALAGMRPMKPADIRPTFQLLKSYLSQFSFHPVFKNEDEFAYWFLPRSSVIHSYVWENPVSRVIENFVSFYELPSKVLRRSKQDGIRTAYLFYYAVIDKRTLPSMIKSILILSKEMGLDVFNCLNVMDNESFISTLKFGVGDGQLRYYLFNWKTKPCLPNQIAFLMQ